jgi:hypothetical protein
MKSIDRKHQPIRYWQELVRKWPASGLSQIAYSRKHGIGRSRFMYWVRKLNPKASICERSGGFVEVKRDIPVQPAFGIELDLPGGITLRLPRTDAETLKTVLRSVREAVC